MRKLRLPILALLLLSGLLSSCEIETEALGIVRDADTGLPIDSVRVMEFAIQKKEQFMITEGYTDSIGRFDFAGGLFGTGGKKTRLILVIEKEGYRPTSVDNHYDEVSVSLVPYD
jgi:hypothetical protein